MMRYLGVAALAAMLGLCSCASERPSTLTASSRTYNRSASEVVQALPAALAAEPMKLGVVESQNGTMQTAWKEGYRGNLHIVRHWQERTRFEVSVVPDWQNPQTASRIEVREQTEERSNPRAAWSQNDTVFRPERAAELLKHIESKLGAAASLAPLAALPARPPAPVPSQNLPDKPTAVELGQPGQPAATAWDTRNGVGVLSVPGTMADAARLVSSELKKANLQLVYERVGEKQGVWQVREGNGPVVTVTAEQRPGNLTRVSLRQPASESEKTGPSLFQSLQAKRAGTPAN